MRTGRTATGFVPCVAMALAITTGVVRAQSVAIDGPAGDPVREGTPHFTVTSSGFAPGDLPLKLRIEVALSADFAAPLFADTTVSGVSADVVIPRLLPPETRVWWRVVAQTAQGKLYVSDATGPRRTPPWVSLLFPNNLNGTTVTTTRPAFLWSAVALLPPVAPWRYTIEISRSSDGFVVLTGTLPDTVYTPFVDLESNTSYRWAVSAVAGTGDSVRVVNSSSFVISSPNAPIATVLFQSFPTPFPSDRLQATCIWFDLRAQSAVALDVFDIHGNHVKTILPGRGLGGILPPGRYGRVALGSDSGCDDRLTWDGTDDRGHFVPAGVYIVRFSGDRVTATRKVLFRGR
ncbi:MAG TPA: hypothetical protein VG916_08185 [Gemmatimonadaceae bacterium]|nr:hypothetical protein [Gemmatimonadaceae bacterium]